LFGSLWRLFEREKSDTVAKELLRHLLDLESAGRIEWTLRLRIAGGGYDVSGWTGELGIDLIYLPWGPTIFRFHAYRMNELVWSMDARTSEVSIQRHADKLVGLVHSAVLNQKEPERKQ